MIFIIPTSKKLVSQLVMLALIGIIGYFAFIIIKAIIDAILLYLFITLFPLILFYDMVTGKIGIWKAIFQSS